MILIIIMMNDDNDDDNNNDADGGGMKVFVFAYKFAKQFWRICFLKSYFS